MIERIESKLWSYDLDSKDPQKDIVLFDNVQFIYELSLAELELNALGVDFEVSNGLREYKALSLNKETEELIKKRASYFKSVNGEYTDYFHIMQKNQTRSVNIFHKAVLNNLSF
ncbi:MAG: hypothetical protein PWQ25_469 [Deferribacteres bacterium]|jgi:hypothetical protein|nr:hypothetical protein [Deferribacteres bacterium]